MKASEARKLADQNKTKEADAWLDNALEIIKEVVSDPKGSSYEVQIFAGEGTFHNKEFVKLMSEREGKLKRLGYRVKRTSRVVPWTMATRYYYYFDISW